MAFGVRKCSAKSIQKLEVRQAGPVILADDALGYKDVFSINLRGTGKIQRERHVGSIVATVLRKF
jgi:hypothetical protein